MRLDSTDDPRQVVRQRAPGATGDGRGPLLRTVLELDVGRAHQLRTLTEDTQYPPRVILQALAHIQSAARSEARGQPHALALQRGGRAILHACIWGNAPAFGQY